MVIQETISYKANHNVREKLVPMFEHMDSTIVLSYLQGHMGDAWVDNLDNPTVAQITVGIWIEHTYRIYCLHYLKNMKLKNG